jgi:thiol-disulfide isomerase/thioredoxin
VNSVSTEGGRTSAAFASRHTWAPAMRKGLSGWIRPAYLAGFGIVLAAVVILVISFTRSGTVAAPPAPGHLFVTPSVGSSTDTVLRLGDDFPEIRTADLAGNAVTLDKQLLGKRCTLVVFWSTWCGFCMQELPHEIELAKRYEKAGLRVIGVNADNTPAIAQAAARQHGVPWLNVFEGPEKSISNQLGITQWPALILLGPDGKVIAATEQLRSVGARKLPDGSTGQVNGLDSILGELLDSKSSKPLGGRRLSGAPGNSE